MKNAVIFDMDGLMINSEPISRSAWERMLNSYGHTMSDEMYGQIIGLRIDRSAQLVHDTYQLPLERSQMIAVKNDYYLEALAEGIPVMGGLFDLLDALQARTIPWAVATSSTRAHAEHLLRTLGIWSACGALVGGNEVLQGKPAPDIYLLAAERLGAAPGNCLALEDSAPGSRAAEAAGMQVVVVPNGVTVSAEFAKTAIIYASLGQVAADLDLLLA